MSKDQYQCMKCKKYFDGSDIYEYRGAFACGEHFDEVQKMRNFQRNEIIAEETAKTEVFRDLDLGDSVVGKANRRLLKSAIEISKKESVRISEYERQKRNTKNTQEN